MRPLKFRVWDGEQMVSPDYIDRDGWARWKANSIPTSSQRVMQFTGLLDRNGTEIWEGDILSPQPVRDEGCWVVEFGGGCFYGTDGDCEIDIRNSSCFKVLGNIHENPEMLEAK